MLRLDGGFRLPRHGDEAAPHRSNFNCGKFLSGERRNSAVMEDRQVSKEKGTTTRAARRVKMLVKRAVRERALGRKHYARATEAEQLARNAGLALNQPVEIELPGVDGAIEKTAFELVDNFAGERVSRSATVH